METSSFLGLATILGPIILLLIFIYVIARNRSSRVSKQMTEDATRRNYEAEDRDNKDDQA